MPNHIVRVHHVAVVVADLAASIAWYRDYLGFDHQYDFALPGARVSMIVRGDARLELYQVEGAAPRVADRLRVDTILKAVGINHLALTVDDLYASVADLEARGVEITIPPTFVPNDSGDRFAFIRDNEQMLVELIEPAG